MVKTRAYCTCMVKTFFKTDESVIAMLRAFCAHFMSCQNDAIPNRKLILLWIENFRTTGLLVEKSKQNKNT